MTIIVDASALYAQANRRDPNYRAVAELLQHEPGALITSSTVVAEADYLILKYLGIDAELEFLDDLAEATFVVDCLTEEELRVARNVARRYRDLELGLADCSLIVLAQRHRIRRIATLDHKHFRAVAPLQGGAFALLPADA